MYVLKSILFFLLLLLVGFSFYHGHYNAAIFEVMIFILIFFKNRYPDSKILHILFTKLAPVPEEGMLRSQYISQLILFNAKYIFILWTAITVMYYFNPDILKNLSQSSSIIPAIGITALFILMLLAVILLVVNLLKYMYIKIFHSDGIYGKE